MAAAKFTEQQKREIALRFANGEHSSVLAKEFGCHRSYVFQMARRFKVRTSEPPHPDLGKRVRVNETSFGGHGRLGTVVGVSKGNKHDLLVVLFDDNQNHPVTWHRGYFDFLDNGDHG